jgi:hypothetical protein
MQHTCYVLLKSSSLSLKPLIPEIPNERVFNISYLYVDQETISVTYVRTDKHRRSERYVRVLRFASECSSHIHVYYHEGKSIFLHLTYG